MECIALSPVHQIHQNMYSERAPKTHSVALKSDSLSINLDWIVIARICDADESQLLFASHVFHMEIGLLSTLKMR